MMCGWLTNPVSAQPRAETLRPCVCQEGTIDILDVGASERLESVAAHDGAVWSLAALPDGSGFVSGSADHDVKFWEWEIVTETAQGDAGCAAASQWLPHWFLAQAGIQLWVLFEESCMRALHAGGGREEVTTRRLGIAHVRTLKMQEDVLCVRVSPNGAFRSTSENRPMRCRLLMSV